MPSRRLTPDVALEVQLSAICSRHRYVTDPGPVVGELRHIAGPRTDILAAVAGEWAGFYASEHTRPLATALQAIDGAGLWVAHGRERRGKPVHGAPDPPAHRSR